MRATRLARLIRCLLFAHPRRSRGRYGEEIVETIVVRVELEHERSGPLGALVLALRESLGLVAAGARMRFAQRSSQRRSIEHGRLRGVTRVARASTQKKGSSMDRFFHDLRLAARGLARQPALTLLAVVALAVGIGATIAIFTVFHAVLLRPLPFPEPERLVAIWEKNPERGWDRAQVAPANYLDWRASAVGFAGMAAYNDWLDERVLVLDGEPSMVLASEVTGGLFDVLGVAPLEGRAFEEAETWAGSEPTVVLSHRFWSRRLAADPEIVGQSLELDGVARRVIGVMPPGFAYPYRDAELWLPVGWRPEQRDQASFRRAHGLRVIGRLAASSSIASAGAELAAIAARLEADYPETNVAMGTGVTPLKEWVVGDSRRPLQVLMAAVSFLLLVACANVSNMLLARSSRRENELRIRSALGSGRARLLVEGLTESLLLAGVGGALGLGLGLAAMGPLLAMSPEGIPRSGEIGVDVAVLLFALGLSLGCGLLFGALPAWRGARHALLPGARGASASRRARRTAGLLVAAEVALTLPLVVGAGLMVRTLGRLSTVETGFDPENVMVASVFLPATRYESDEEIVAFYRELFERARSLPGVEAAAMSARLPFVNARWTSDFTAEGWTPDRYGINVRHDEITPGLFRTMGVPLLRGRDFELTDDLDATPVVIVNRALADRYFPGSDPLGQRVCFDRVPEESSVWRTIVGVVGNVRRDALSLEEEPSFYAPVLQDTTRQMFVLSRSERARAEIVPSLRESLRAMDPGLPLFDVTSLEAVVADSLARERFLLALLGLAAAVALLLATVGIFGVVLHATTARSREIGIRVALGARSTEIVALVLRGGLGPVVAGIAVGLLAAAALSRAMASFLFEVLPLDPLTFAGVVALMLLAALLACAPPARWATRLDAASTLRSE